MKSEEEGNVSEDLRGGERGDEGGKKGEAKATSFSYVSSIGNCWCPAVAFLPLLTAHPAPTSPSDWPLGPFFFPPLNFPSG